MNDDDEVELRQVKYKVTVSMGLVGCHREHEFEVDEGTSPDEIDDLAREILFDKLISWDVKRVDGEDS